MKVLFNFVLVISLTQSVLHVKSSSVLSATTVSSSFIGDESFTNDLRNERYQSTAYQENEVKTEFSNIGQESMQYESAPQEVIY